jgi:hypothetical protein
MLGQLLDGIMWKQVMKQGPAFNWLWMKCGAKDSSDTVSQRSLNSWVTISYRRHRMDLPCSFVRTGNGICLILITKAAEYNQLAWELKQNSLFIYTKVLYNIIIQGIKFKQFNFFDLGPLLRSPHLTGPPHSGPETPVNPNTDTWKNHVFGLCPLSNVS